MKTSVVTSRDVTELRLDQIELLDRIRELLCDVAHTLPTQSESLLTDVGDMILEIDRTIETLR